MTGWWTIGKFALVSAAVTLVTAAALLSLALAYPKPISSAELGAGWQCTRTFIWTSCKRTGDTEAAVLVRVRLVLDQVEGVVQRARPRVEELTQQRRKRLTANGLRGCGRDGVGVRGC